MHRNVNCHVICRNLTEGMLGLMTRLHVIYAFYGSAKMKISQGVAERDLLVQMVPDDALRCKPKEGGQGEGGRGKENWWETVGR